MTAPEAGVTQLLIRRQDGDLAAAGELMPIVYEQLRAVAGSYFRGQGSHTLQPTALVHEAFIKMVDRESIDWRGRAHFCATCAMAMRQILTDHARARRAEKRGGGWQRVGLTANAQADDGGIDALALDDALGQLAERNERQAKIVECRFLGGMTVEEIACALDTSVSTVEREWRVARAYLSRILGADEISENE